MAPGVGGFMARPRGVFGAHVAVELLLLPYVHCLSPPSPGVLATQGPGAGLFPGTTGSLGEPAKPRHILPPTQCLLIVWESLLSTAIYCCWYYVKC